MIIIIENLKKDYLLGNESDKELEIDKNYDKNILLLNEMSISFNELQFN
jgi:hypothetical protein